MRPVHLKQLDLRTEEVRYAEKLEAAEVACRKCKNRGKIPTASQVANIAGPLCGMTPDSYLTNFLCKDLKPEDKVFLKFRRQLSRDGRKLEMMMVARKLCTAKPTRLGLAAKASRLGGISKRMMLVFAAERLTDDNIRALDLAGEGALTTRRTPKQGLRVHDSMIERRGKRAVAPRRSTKAYTQCLIAVYKTQLKPAHEQNVATVAAEAKMPVMEVAHLFEQHPNLAKLLAA
jgi:hypothetical protein